jgi:hypothetical protein
MSRTRVAVIAAAGVLVALFGGRWIAVQYTAAVWYADLGQGAQFRRLLGDRLLWQFLTFGVASLWYGAHTFAVHASVGGVQLPRRIGNIEIAEAVPRRVLRGVAAGLALLLGLLTALTFQDIAGYVTLFRAAAPLGLPEPVFGRDASYYLARLPLIETLHLLVLVSVVTALPIVAGLYALTGGLEVRQRRLAASAHARVHLTAILAVLALVLAWGFRLDAIQMVAGGGGDAGALTAVDRGLRIPAATALAALATVVAVLTILFVRRGRGIALLAVWVALGAAAIVGRYAVPFVQEQWGERTDPTVSLAVADLSERYARAGFGLLDVRAEALASRAAPEPESLSAVGRALAGLSPWGAEPGLLTGWLATLVSDSGPPRLWTTTVSAYPGRDGRPSQVAVGVPETDVLALLRSAERPDWTQLHRGAPAWGGTPVVVDLSEVEAAAVPASGAVTRVGTLPVRFLAHEAELGVVGEDARVPGAPPVGVPLRGFVRRLLLAWALQAPPLLGRRTSASDRVLYWRDVPQRLVRLYPFATFEAPRAVLAGGRLVWVATGFLASDRFPLADHVAWHGEPVNFLRAAYAATVDAATGATRLYLREPDFGFARRLAEADGARALPADSLPMDLLPHLGYPGSLFAAQAEVLARHHGEPGQAPWVLAREASADPRDQRAEQRPAPVEALITLAGRSDVWHILPLADGGGNRLMGFVAGTSSGVGPLTPLLLRLPSLDFPTLAAAESRLNATPAVVGAVAGAAGPEGAVHRSPVVALPVAGTVVYAQAIFASPRRMREPLGVHGMVLMAGGRVGVGADVAAAARVLASIESPGFVESAPDPAMTAARTAFLALDSASRRGDWVAFGRSMDVLRRALGIPAAARKP